MTDRQTDRRTDAQTMAKRAKHSAVSRKNQTIFMNFGETISSNDLDASHSISIILNGSQLNAGSLIQGEKNRKTPKRIQKKMMRSRSTLDWSQSNNIFVSK